MLRQSRMRLRALSHFHSPDRLRPPVRAGFFLKTFLSRFSIALKTAVSSSLPLQITLASRGTGKGASANFARMGTRPGRALLASRCSTRLATSRCSPVRTTTRRRSRRCAFIRRCTSTATRWAGRIPSLVEAMGGGSAVLAHAPPLPSPLVELLASRLGPQAGKSLVIPQGAREQKPLPLDGGGVGERVGWVAGPGARYFEGEQQCADR